MTEHKDDNELTAADVRDGVTVPQAGHAGVKTRLAQWGIPVLAGAALLAVMAAVSLVTVRLTQPEIVTFDMKGTMDTFLQQSMQLHLDEPQTKALVVNFNTELTRSLADWQTRHHAVILVAPAVVSTQRDITAEIQNAVAGAMSKGRPQPPFGEVK